MQIIMANGHGKEVITRQIGGQSNFHQIATCEPFPINIAVRGSLLYGCDLYPCVLKAW